MIHGWRILFLQFKASERRNYSMEAYDVLLSPHKQDGTIPSIPMAEQTKMLPVIYTWSF
jgi:hypothetical protein